MALLGSLQGRRLQTALAFTCAVAWILQGYDQGFMNGLLTLPTFIATFPQLDTSTPALSDKNSVLKGAVVAIFEVGAAAGALSCYYLGDKYGRKRPTIGAGIVALVGVILQSTSYQLAQLAVGRMITGLGVGCFTATIPSWVGESIAANHRGKLIMVEGCFGIGGLVFAGWLELGLYFTKSDVEVAWRFPIAFQAIPAIFVLCTAPFLTESPRWLIYKDRLAEGRQVIARLEGEAEDSEVVDARVRVILSAIHADQLGHSKNPFASTPNKHRTRTLLAIGANFFSQMSGISVITFYSNTVFEQYLGYSPILSRVISDCLQTWQLTVAVVTVFMVDRFGRRRLLMIGAAGMCIAQIGNAAMQANAGKPGVAGAGLIFYFIALASFPLGLFFIPFLYSSEIAPLPIRAQVTSMSAATNWLFSFLVAMVSPIAFSHIGWKYYIVYIVIDAVAVLCFYLFYPETKERSLEDIDAIFLSARNVFELRTLAKTVRVGIAEEVDLGKEGVLDREAERVEFVGGDGGEKV